MSWRQANITDVSVSLTDDKKGLVIEATSENGTRYQLKIPKFHGQVEDVKEISQAQSITGESLQEKELDESFEQE